MSSYAGEKNEFFKIKFQRNGNHDKEELPVN